MKAQQQSDTDSHIAISGEVTVNLQSIPVYSHQILETGIKGRIIKDTLHEVDTDIIGNDCFLEQTPARTSPEKRKAVSGFAE